MESTAAPVAPTLVQTVDPAQLLGMAECVDALVPYVEFQEFMTDRDDTRGFYKLEPFNDFAPEVERWMKQKGPSKNDPMVIFCRSGECSARAADFLSWLGYAEVYAVVHGFTGETSGRGRRNLNGWKNDGLPWSDELDRSRMYFPH